MVALLSASEVEILSSTSSAEGWGRVAMVIDHG